MQRLPDFSLEDYETLVRSFLAFGYQALPVGSMPRWEGGKALYLRHDVDFHMNGILGFAHIEAELGIAASYYILLTGYYNPMLRQNRRILGELVRLGHEIGLHYDLTTFPEDPDDARVELDRQADVLSSLAGTPVTTITMHEPSSGHEDYFRETDEFVHPHDPRLQEAMTYVSDSCRAWRDHNVLSCFGDDGPLRMHLNLHPELWLNSSIADRIDYISRVNAGYSSEFSDWYFKEHMGPRWLKHEAVLLHEQREAAPVVPLPSGFAGSDEREDIDRDEPEAANGD